MLRGVYRAAAAMLTEMLRQDIHAHNLANANTSGFKRQLASVGPTSLDMADGDVHVTDAPLDVALRGRGFFVVDTGSGRLYTRDGHFALSAQGLLVNGVGALVLGLRGPIRLRGSRVEIGEDGSVFSDGAFVDKLLVVDFPAGTDLEHGPDVAVVGSRPPGASRRYTLVSGALEASNVNPIAELSAMRGGFRIYEANARTISQFDHSLGKLIDAATG